MRSSDQDFTVKFVEEIQFKELNTVGLQCNGAI